MQFLFLNGMQLLCDFEREEFYLSKRELIMRLYFGCPGGTVDSSGALW